MLTIEATAVVDDAHRLTVPVPASVRPGAHEVIVVIRDGAGRDTGRRPPMRALPDFIARQDAAGMQPLSAGAADLPGRLIAGEAV